MYYIVRYSTKERYALVGGAYESYHAAEQECKERYNLPVDDSNRAIATWIDKREGGAKERERTAVDTSAINNRKFTKVGSTTLFTMFEDNSLTDEELTRAFYYAAERSLHAGREHITGEDLIRGLRFAGITHI